MFLATCSPICAKKVICCCNVLYQRVTKCVPTLNHNISHNQQWTLHILPSLSGNNLFHPKVDSPDVRLPGCKLMLPYLFVDLLNLLKTGVKVKGQWLHIWVNSLFQCKLHIEYLKYWHSNRCDGWGTCQLQYYTLSFSISNLVTKIVQIDGPFLATGKGKQAWLKSKMSRVSCFVVCRVLLVTIWHDKFWFPGTKEEKKWSHCWA